jgi:DNA-directed RNA polymerase subunit RPC12/RpoP
MGFIKERVAYLRGLAEGMKISDETNEGKLLRSIIDVMDDIALAIDDIEEVQDQLGEQIDNMDEDLAEVEKVVFDCDCDDDEDDDILAEVECPHCGEIIELEEDMLDDEAESFECPYCGKDIAVEWDCDCDDCCDHDHDDE